MGCRAFSYYAFGQAQMTRFNLLCGLCGTIVSAVMAGLAILRPGSFRPSIIVLLAALCVYVLRAASRSAPDVRSSAFIAQLNGTVLWLAILCGIWYLMAGTLAAYSTHTLDGFRDQQRLRLLVSVELCWMFLSCSLRLYTFTKHGFQPR